MERLSVMSLVFCGLSGICICRHDEMQVTTINPSVFQQNSSRLCVMIFKTIVFVYFSNLRVYLRTSVPPGIAGVICIAYLFFVCLFGSQVHCNCSIWPWQPSNKVHLEMCASSRHNRYHFYRTLFALFGVHAGFHTLSCKQTSTSGQLCWFIFTLVIWMSIMCAVFFWVGVCVCHVMSFLAP